LASRTGRLGLGGTGRPPLGVQSGKAATKGLAGALLGITLAIGCGSGQPDTSDAALDFPNATTDGAEVGWPIAETDVFESLLAIPPATDVCRQDNLPVDAALPVMIVHGYCEFVPDGLITPFLVDVDYPLMGGPHAASINGHVRATVKDLLATFLGAALDNSARLVDQGYPYEAPFRLTGGVTLATERLYSVELPLWYYVPGAAHGDNAVRNFTFDLETGERVRLADLFLPYSRWRTTLEASLEDALRDSKEAGTIQHLCQLGAGPWEYEDGIYADTFNVTEDALRIYHWLRPYACRVEPFDIPYTELVEVLDPHGPLEPCESSRDAALMAACGSGDVVFDVTNATLDLDCGMGPGGPAPFVDGEWINEVDSLNRAWVVEWTVVELVEESPGAEVVTMFACSGGGSHTQLEVHVYAGNSGEANRLGRVRGEILEGVLEGWNVGDGAVFTRVRLWQDYDPHCCPSKYELITNRWQDGGWVETDVEVWGREQPPPSPSVTFYAVEGRS